MWGEISLCKFDIRENVHYRGGDRRDQAYIRKEKTN